MPDFIPPMKATPVDAPVHRSGLAVRGQVGWLPGGGRRRDGAVRTVDPAAAGRSRVLPRSRRREAGSRHGTAIVDGEVVALDDQGRPRFSLLQDHTGIRTGRNPGGKRRGAPAQIVYEAFDLLHLDGRSPARHAARGAKTPPHACARTRWSDTPDTSRPMASPSSTQRDGRRLEGIVAKCAARTSRAGPPQQGLAQAEGAPRAGGRRRRVAAGAGERRELGSLILAVRSGDRWVHAGQVGSGFNARARQTLPRSSKRSNGTDSPLDPAPRLRGARWVEPRLVIRVEFAEWTADGLLRQAAYKGIEPGKDPHDVHRERAVSTAKATEEAERAHASRATARQGDELPPSTRSRRRAPGPSAAGTSGSQPRQGAVPRPRR